MSFWTAAVIIVAIAALTNVLRARYKAEASGKTNARLDQELERKNHEAEEELKKLRERVKVLERIATDPARRTAEEIESLRDKQD